MQVIDYENHGGVHMDNVIRTESTWLIVINNTEIGMHGEEMRTFLDTVKEHLVQDRCMLHRSKHSRRKIILRIHCPYMEIVDETEEDTLIQSPTLIATEAYLLSVFSKQSVLVGRNDVHTSPKQWYGTYEHMDTILRGEHHLKQASYGVLKEREQEKLYSANLVQHGVVPWNLDRIAMRFGLPTGSYMYFNDGSDVDVYVVDTGIMTTHVEFGGRATFLHNTIRDKLNTDCNGHGTHVAGIIGAETYGVAKKTNLYAVRVLDCAGEGSVDDILEGVDVVIERATRPGARRSVINLSLGGKMSAIVDAMIRELKANGLVVVLAAGNEGRDACGYSPSNMGKDNEVLSVGATDNRDYRPSWSNYGECVSIFAPGAAITSTWFTSNTAIHTISGTSMASPMTAGVAALILHQDASLSVDKVNALVVECATPNIVSYALSTSRSKSSASLLYALINVSVSLSGTSSSSLQSVVSVPQHNSGEETSAPTLILCITITALGLLCLS